MLVFTTRNAVLVALFQVGVIVFGVLTSGLSQKWWASLNTPLPATTLFLIHYGVVLLCLPVLWIAVVLRVGLSAWADEVKGLAFGSGFILILGLLIFIGYAVLAPWRHHDFHVFDQPQEETSGRNLSPAVRRFPVATAVFSSRVDIRGQTGAS